MPPRPRSRSAHARADYPDRPIDWIVAYAAGGGSDTVARHPGRAHGAGAGPVARDREQARRRRHHRRRGRGHRPTRTATRCSPPTTARWSSTRRCSSKLSYDPAKDFRAGRPDGPLSPAPGGPARFGVDRLARAWSSGPRRRPAPIDYASPGVGSPHHLPWRG